MTNVQTGIPALEVSGAGAYIAPLRALPGIMKKVARPHPVQTEALSALRDVAAFLANPPGGFDLVAFDQLVVKARAMEKKQSLTTARSDAAGELGCTLDAYMKALGRERTGRRRSSKRLGQSRP